MMREKMKLTSLLATIFLVAGSTNVAWASGITIVTLTGKCLRATAMDVLINPNQCSNKVINMEYPNGRIGFMFVLTEKDNSSAVFSFSGIGSEQIHKDKDNVVQPINLVVTTFNGKTIDLKAVGTCAFSNPFKNIPAKVSCIADTSKGKFAGEFISDGNRPDVSQAVNPAIDQSPQVLRRDQADEVTSAKAANSQPSIAVGQRITYSGSFTNTTYSLGGNVTIEMTFEQNNKVSGYINFTNRPGESLICGAGNFQGNLQGHDLNLRFISSDSDPGCGFEQSWSFIVNATLSPDGRRLENGTYQVNNTQAGVFQAVLSNSTTAMIPDSAQPGKLTLEQSRSLKSLGIKIAVPSYVPTGFTVASVTMEPCSSNEQRTATGVCRYGPEYRILYRNPQRACFEITAVGGGLGGPGGDFVFPVQIKLLGETTVNFGKTPGAEKPASPQQLTIPQPGIWSWPAGQSPYYGISTVENRDGCGANLSLTPSEVKRVLQSLTWL